MTNLLDEVASPDINDNAIRIRELARDVKRVGQGNQDSFIWKDSDLARPRVTFQIATFVLRLHFSNVLDARLELGLRLLQLREGVGEMCQFLR